MNMCSVLFISSVFTLLTCAPCVIVCEMCYRSRLDFEKGLLWALGCMISSFILQAFAIMLVNAHNSANTLPFGAGVALVSLVCWLVVGARLACASTKRQ